MKKDFVYPIYNHPNLSFEEISLFFSVAQTFIVVDRIFIFVTLLAILDGCKY